MIRTPTGEKLAAAFAAHYKGPPAFVVKAPGRVNLIGDHTDYNDGFVLPMAINFAVRIALRPRPDRRVILHSLDFNEAGQFSLDDLHREGTGWVEYVKGAAWALQATGRRLTGFEGVMHGDVPIGSGLSSSAALEMAVIRAFCAVSDIQWNPVEMAETGRMVENQWLGLQTGIMDQLISAAGVKDHALLIDCRSLATRPVPLPSMPDGEVVAVVILDTGTRRGLVDSVYNERRAKCEAGARVMGVTALRDADWDTYRHFAGSLPEDIRRRVHHVISENERTLAAAQAMADNDVTQLGLLMNASHASLRDDYAVSSPELDFMVETAQKTAGCFGARMTGAGFGGCAVAIVNQQDIQSFRTTVASAYRQTTGIEPLLYVCRAVAGVKCAGYAPGQL